MDLTEELTILRSDYRISPSQEFSKLNCTSCCCASIVRVDEGTHLRHVPSVIIVYQCMYSLNSSVARYTIIISNSSLKYKILSIKVHKSFVICNNVLPNHVMIYFTVKSHNG